MANRDESPQKPSTTFDPHIPETTGVRISSLEPERQNIVTSSSRHGVPGVDVRVVPLDLTDLDVLPRDLARRYGVLPLLVKDDTMLVAMADPGSRQALSEVEFVTGKHAYPYAADPDALRELIDRAYDLRARGQTELQPETPSIAPPPAFATRPSSPQIALRGPTPPPPLGTPRRARLGTMLDAGGAATGSTPPPLTVGPPSRAPSPPRAFTPPAASTARAPIVPMPASAALALVPDVVALSVLREALAPMGFALTPTATAKDFFAGVSARGTVPGLLVIDTDLPDAHGFEVVHRVRAMESLMAVPIVVTTADREGWRIAGDLGALYAVGAVLERPFPPAEVVLRVGEALNPTADVSDALPADAEAALKLCTEAWQRGDLAAAVVHLELAVSQAPDSFRLHYQLGLAQGRLGEVFRALRALERSVALCDRYFPSLKNLAVLYEKVGFRNKALESWERAYRVAPDDATRTQIKERVIALFD